MKPAARVLLSASFLFLAASSWAAEKATDKGPLKKIQVNPAKEQTPGHVADPVPALHPDETPVVSTAAAPAPEAVLAPPAAAPAVPARAQERLDAARAAFQAGRNAEARRMAERLTDDEKKFAGAWTLRGDIALADKKPKVALKRFNRALKFDPHDADAFFGKGQAYEALGKLDEAANEYQAALHANENLLKAREAWDRLKPQTAPQAG